MTGAECLSVMKTIFAGYRAAKNAVTQTIG